MPRPLARSLFAAMLVAPALCAQGDVLYSVTSNDGFLRAVDPLTATTISSVQMVDNNAQNVTICNGLAVDPLSGTLYAVIRGNGPNRNLAIIAVPSGFCVNVGALGDNVAGIAFSATGTLYGVTGDGANVPESLYTINTGTAQMTFVRAFGAGNDGESITIAADGFLYHASGLGTPNVDEVFERLDLLSNTLLPLPLSGFDYDEMLAMTPWVGGNLLAADLNDELMVINTSGVVTSLGVLDHSFVKGLAFLPSTTVPQFYRPFGTACAGSNGRIPLLVGNGLPAPGQQSSLELLLAPPNTLAVSAIGTGNIAFPFPSAACQVQILPLVDSLSEGLFTGPAGTGSRSISLPPGFPAIDLYLQMGIFDGLNLIVSNPLLMHIQ